MTDNVIVPTIGRRVWYKESGLSDQFCDAGICYVWEGGTDTGNYLVNLTVASRNGEMLSRTSVELIQGPPEECGERQACWMPYQKGQAAKEKKSE